MDNATNTTADFTYGSEAFRIVHLIACTLLIVVGLTGNTIVVAVIASTKKLHTVMSAYVVSLAIADLLACLTTLAVSFSVAINDYDWQFDFVTCRVMAIVHIISRVTANYSLTLLAVDRCIAIWVSLRYSSIHTKYVAAAEISFVWVLGIIIAFLPLMAGQKYQFIDPTVTCQPSKEREVTEIVILVLGFVLPLIFTVICYSSIGYVAVKQAKRGTLVCDENNCHFVPNRKKELKVLKTPLSVTGVAILCWLPYLVIGLGNINASDQVNFYLNVTFGTLSECTTAINPILYMTLYQPCRTAILQYKNRLVKYFHKNSESERKVGQKSKASNHKNYNKPTQSEIAPEISKSDRN